MAMPIVKSERWPVRSGEDIVRVRQIVRRWAVELGFGLVDQTKIVTAASEIARNTVVGPDGSWRTLLDDSEGDAWRFYTRLSWERC